MKFRHSNQKGEKIEPQMAPMIDVVFQLLIFFMLTLKIVEQEGDFNINMPVSNNTPSATQPDINLQPFKVRMHANASGQLVRLEFNGQNLGNGPRAFEELNAQVLQAIGGRPGNELTKDQEVEIEADAGLHYEYVIDAVSACTGRLEADGEGGVRTVRYLEKIKFAPAVETSAAG